MGGPEWIFELLQDKDYTIYPYARGVYPPDTLYALYSTMVSEGTLSRVLYAEKWLDLEAFCAYFASTVLFLAVTPDNQTVLGAVWFTEVKQHKANIGLWMSRRVQTSKIRTVSGQRSLARSITNRVVECAFRLYHWRTIWGITPWRAVVHHGEAIGFKLMSTVPDGIETASGKTLPLYVLRRDIPEFQLIY